MNSLSIPFNIPNSSAGDIKHKILVKYDTGKAVM
jgi:hypothetical protein